MGDGRWAVMARRFSAGHLRQDQKAAFRCAKVGRMRRLPLTRKAPGERRTFLASPEPARLLATLRSAAEACHLQRRHPVVCARDVMAIAK